MAKNEQATVKRTNLYNAAIVALLSMSSVVASADEQAQELSVTRTTPEAEAPSAPPLPIPISPTLPTNPNPFSLDLGPVGKIYTSGIVTGMGLFQDNSPAGDQDSQGDLNNAHLFIQKSDGLAQFFVQAGYYSVPVLGVPYTKASDSTNLLFDAVPQAYLKIAPTKELSVQVGKLPTLIGAESTFTFQNMNIQRGLLWNQENAVNRGVQVNYAGGPLSVSASLNDGFYSGEYSWVSMSASYAVDSNNTLTLGGGANTKHSHESSFATPVAQNNQQIYNLIYMHTDGPWTFQPYIQYTHVPKIEEVGINHSASTLGGALLMSYDFDSDATPAGLRLPGFKLPVRLEYISSSGDADNGAPNLLGYGVGSNAWSFTITPTYQYQRLFARADLAYVGASNTTSGMVFGSTGNKHSETRAMIEAGIFL
jgi:hypothetical protein